MEEDNALGGVYNVNDQDDQGQQQNAAPQVAVGAMPVMTPEQFQLFLLAIQSSLQPPAPAAPARLPDSDPSHWKYVKPNDIATHEGKKDKTRTAAWIKNLQDYAEIKALPRSQWTRLAVMRLTGGAAVWFEGYVDPSTGSKGDCTLDWDLFVKAYTRTTVDIMNAEQIKAAFEGDKLRQHTSVERCVEIWNEWLDNYRCCEDLADFYSEKQLIDKFIRGLKGPVSAMVRTNKDIKTFEDAIEAAKTIDPLLFNANKNPTGGGFRGAGQPGTATGSSNSGGARAPYFNRSREGTPGPPGTPASVHSLSDRDQAIMNALNALGTQFSGRSFPPRSGGATPSSSGSLSYNMKNPPPKMTQGIREWCDRNCACYRCRQANAGHMS
jgi:hypothetical protein